MRASYDFQDQIETWFLCGFYVGMTQFQVQKAELNITSKVSLFRGRDRSVCATTGKTFPQISYNHRWLFWWTLLIQVFNINIFPFRDNRNFVVRKASYWLLLSGQISLGQAQEVVDPPAARILDFLPLSAWELAASWLIAVRELCSVSGLWGYQISADLGE